MLRGELAARPSARQVVVDEVQKVPQLLDEVHWLHEHQGIHFALCGSSARKVKRGQANLLGGRAVRYELLGLTAQEIGRDFHLDRMLNHGYLPRMYLSSTLKGLRSLVEDHPRIKRRVVVGLEPRSRRTDDGILILSATDFPERLGAGDLF